MINLFGNKRYKDPEKEREKEEKLERLRSEKLGKKDILALIIVAFETIIPVFIVIVLIYFLVILFLTKVWMK